MTVQTVLTLSEQQAQYQRELAAFDSVLWSTARMLNYFAWDEDKALKVMDAIHAKACSWPKRFPQLVDEDDHNVMKATGYYYDILADAEPIVANQRFLNAQKWQMSQQSLVATFLQRFPKLGRSLKWLNRPVMF
ncbi:hypothetical protein [Vibrio jasicida]|uniref:hypothetical protein n=1 Tax=Vibrio jasicida TaxID=766224 RepID=UPI0005EE4CBC|nr:hypothetical protein [Vibrio jasicida]